MLKKAMTFMNRPGEAIENTNINDHQMSARPVSAQNRNDMRYDASARATHGEG